MKKLFVLLSVLYCTLFYGTATAGSRDKVRLNDSLPAWSEILPCDTTTCPRFESVFGGAAVLDHETGIVWEQSPSPVRVSWYEAAYYCAQLVVGGRSGWHLPTIEQLSSLTDQTVNGAPKLPTGHPFTVEQNPAAWSGTTYENNQNLATAWGVEFFDGNPLPAVKSLQIRSAWCVRGQ